MPDLLIYISVSLIFIIIGFIAGRKISNNDLENSLLLNENKLQSSNEIIKNLKENNTLLIAQANQLQNEKHELNLLLNTKEVEFKNSRQEINVLDVKLDDFEKIKSEKNSLEIRIKNIENEKNLLNDENIRLKKDEEGRINDFKKSIQNSNTLQESLEKEKKRLINERLVEQEKKFKLLKETWSNHEKDVETHIRLICKNNVIKYIESSDFPHSRNKPDNVIEILEQLIIFDAKSPANDDLNNFPKYIKSQTESLKKYAKYSEVKNDLFLVIPTNTAKVIKDFIYNIGDYNVYIITKDSLEPIILSLKKIEEYEFVDKLSPEERDNICRIIGKFAHTTKRKIQIEQFFAREFLDILQKSKTSLPKEILKTVIHFENAEKINPPNERRKKTILTSDLMENNNELNKEIELRNIPKIEAKITYTRNENKLD